MNGKFDLQKAKEAIIAEREDVALRLLEPLAHQGNADAQFLYGVLTRSLDWIRKATDHPEACYFLACATPTDDGFDFHAPVDENGWALLHKAAELDSIAAQTDLGRFYMVGVPGLEKNPALAVRWLSLAVQYRRWTTSDALYWLGLMRLEGIGASQNITEGLRLLSSCAMKQEVNSYSLQAARLLFKIWSEGLYRQPILNEDQLEEVLLHVHFQEEGIPEIVPKWRASFQIYVSRSLVYVLDNVTTEEFAYFLFDHLEPVGDIEDRNLQIEWDWNVRVECQSERLLALYTQLFREPSFLLEQFTRRQLEAGFWAVISHHDWSLGYCSETKRFHSHCVRYVFARWLICSRSFLPSMPWKLRVTCGGIV